MQPTVLILCPQSPDASDSSVAKIAEFLGVTYRYITLEELLDNIAISPDLASNTKTCLALSGDTLVTVHKNGSLNRILSRLLDSVSFVLLHSVSPSVPLSDALNFLSDGVLRSVSILPNNNFSYTVNPHAPDVSRQFSGLTFGPINSQFDFVFDLGKTTPDADTIISIDGRAMFLRIRRGSCHIFAMAVSMVQDINGRATGSISAARDFSTIVPVLMFLKYIFRDHCWHTDTSQACLVVDDPLLHRRYGFLDYNALLRTMKRDNFFTTIAFIPWNHRRTQQETAELFKNNTDSFSVCVHGCNHTSGEFGLTDYAEIDNKVKLATRRMMAHYNSTGLGFDNVMVFPQGIFSTTAMKALKSNNYAAAVNSDVLPIDSAYGLRIADLMEPAIMAYDNFPLFHRRYPDKIADFAFDLFLGKPALIVVHHDYFREGYERISGFVRKMNSLNDSIQWKGLREVARESYWWRQESNNRTVVKLYTNSTWIHNTSNSPSKYSIAKYETNNVPLKGVYVDGQQVSYLLENRVLKIDIEIGPQASADVAIVYKDLNPNTKEERRILDNAKISVRRHLSEIKDNYISKNRFLQSLARKAKILRN